MTILDEKAKLRNKMLHKLRAQPAHEKQTKSISIQEKLREEPTFRDAKVVMFYVATEHEVETMSFIKETIESGKKVAVPFVDHLTNRLLALEVHDPYKDLYCGSYGVLEPRPSDTDPVDVSDMDLIIVPGVAFDGHGNRLGHGKGYYDRFLKTVPTHIQRFGLAFDFQMCDEIPVTLDDSRVDKIITNE